ncbi:hypothetical protein GCM10011402_28930 [Paracoccus acridae]|uniref:Uncharacterized protein n=1 Tax=Paracoccus acridae TaxID=1795310 RepID=A0ABQ1VM24_9RHOB|nr:hypothetical protein GCM10011402_28930 [Paracoccus acridae]
MEDVPAHTSQGLEGATEDEPAALKLQGSGYGLHREALAADLSVPGLLAGRFGTKAHTAQMAEQVVRGTFDVLNALSSPAQRISTGEYHERLS